MWRQELFGKTQQALAGQSETKNITFKTFGLLVVKEIYLPTYLPDAGAFRRRPDDFQITLKV